MSNLFTDEVPGSMSPRSPALPGNWRAAIEHAVAAGLSVEVKFNDEDAEQARQASADRLPYAFAKYAEASMLDRDGTRLLSAMNQEGGTDVRAALAAAMAQSGQKPHYLIFVTDGPVPEVEGLQRTD